MSQKHYSSHDITISQVLDLVRPRIKKEANGRGQMQIVQFTKRKLLM